MKSRIDKKWVKWFVVTRNRSNHLGVFFKKGVLENFAKFTGNYLCRSVFFNKVTGLKTASLLNKRPQHRCFPVNFTKFSITRFFIDHN